MDLAHAISCAKAIAEASKYQDLFVPHRMLTWIEFMGIRATTPPNDNHDPRDYLDGESAELSDEDRQRIAKGMTAIRDVQAAENAYEAGKYE